MAVSRGGHARLEQTMAQQCLSTEQLALVGQCVYMTLKKNELLR